MKNNGQRFENNTRLVIGGPCGHFAPWEIIPAQWQSFGFRLGKMVGRAAYALCFNLSNGLDCLSGIEAPCAAPSELSCVNISRRK